MDTKQEDLAFIKKFTKISVNKVCNELGYNTANILKGKATSERVHNVRRLIEEKQAKLYLMEDKDDKETNAL